MGRVAPRPCTYLRGNGRTKERKKERKKEMKTRSRARQQHAPYTPQHAPHTAHRTAYNIPHTTYTTYSIYHIEQASSRLPSSTYAKFALDVVVMIDPAPYARASCSPTEPVPPEPPRIKTVFPVNVAFNSEPYHANALYDVSATLYVSACGVVWCVWWWGWTGNSIREWKREGKGNRV